LLESVSPTSQATTTKLTRSNRIPPSSPHPPSHRMLLSKQKLLPISLVSWNPSSTSSTSKRPRTSSDHPSAHGRRRWGGDGSSPNDGPSSNGYDAWSNGCSCLYACSYGSWTCISWWTDDGWTVWATGVETAATDVSGAYAASTSQSTSASAPSTTAPTSAATPTTTSSATSTTSPTTSPCAVSRRPCPATPQQTTDVSRTYSPRYLFCAPSISPTPLDPTSFQTISLFTSTTPCRTKWIWTKAW
jgi:hypothetical protein